MDSVIRMSIIQHFAGKDPLFLSSSRAARSTRFSRTPLPPRRRSFRAKVESNTNYGRCGVYPSNVILPGINEFIYVERILSWTRLQNCWNEYIHQRVLFNLLLPKSKRNNLNVHSRLESKRVLEHGLLMWVISPWASIQNLIVIVGTLTT